MLLVRKGPVFGNPLPALSNQLTQGEAFFRTPGSIVQRWTAVYKPQQACFNEEAGMLQCRKLLSWYSLCSFLLWSDQTVDAIWRHLCGMLSLSLYWEVWRTYRDIIQGQNWNASGWGVPLYCKNMLIWQGSFLAGTFLLQITIQYITKKWVFFKTARGFPWFPWSFLLY